MRKVSGLALSTLWFLLATSCVNGPQETATGGTAAAPHTGPVRIGFSMDTLKEERWQRDKMLVEQRAKEVGADLDVQVANGDDAVQTKQADNLLTKGVDVLIVAPHNGEIAASIVEAAHRKGVPVIAYDRLIRDSDVDLYISHQVERMGEMQAKYALDHIPKGNYVLIGGSPTDYNAILLRKGQMNVLKAAIDRGDVKIISDQFAREWKAEEALRITEDALTKTGKNIQAIVASNDGTAGGAISALEAAGLAGKVLVTGQDAQKDAVQRIVKGTQSMTVYKQIQPLAFGAVDAAILLAQKKPVQTHDKINNGRKDVPAILLEPMVVDKANVDATVIKDGYHKREDIYGH
ncbi:MAG: D-xylose transport system substrate-binding protein [Thermoanaerobaculia bacterium]|jgi:D-xylose transport system substrate-binding protein|nr:D-xylose transport system substrate-binding protein [Thermoanaerobaculia bacterium]